MMTESTMTENAKIVVDSKEFEDACKTFIQEFIAEVKRSACNPPIFVGFATAPGATLGTYEAFEAAYKVALLKYKASPRSIASHTRLEKKITEIEGMLRNRL